MNGCGRIEVFNNDGDGILECYGIIFFVPGKSSVYTWWLIVLTYSIHSSSTRVSSSVIYGVGGMVTWYRLVRESHEQYVLKTRPVHPMHFRVGTSSSSLKMKSYWSVLGHTQFDKVLLVTNCIGLTGISCSWLSPSFTGCRPVRVAYYDLLLHKWYFSNLMGGRNLVRDWEDEIFFGGIEVTDSQRMIEYGICHI